MKTTTLFKKIGLVALIAGLASCDAQVDVGKRNLGQQDTGVPVADGLLPADTCPASTDCAKKSDAVLSPDTGPQPDQGAVICKPSAKTCADLGNLHQCNSSGTAYLPNQPCPDYTFCSSGACYSAGDVQGSVVVDMIVYANPFNKSELLYLPNMTAKFGYKMPAATPVVTPAADQCLTRQYGSATTSGTYFDAGPITVSGAPSGNLVLTYDPQNSVYQYSPKLTKSSFPYAATLSFSGAGKNLVHGPFSFTLQVPSLRVVTDPTEGASHAQGSDLTVKWSGSTGTGKLELQVHGTGPNHYVVCSPTDDGEFTILASLLSSFSKGKLDLAFAGGTNKTVTVKGLSSMSAASIVGHWIKINMI